jgi:hypothetical protein
MSMRSKILLYAGLACTALMLAPTTAAAAATGPPAARPNFPSLVVSSPPIPLPNNTNKPGTATCPAGMVVLSGGAYIANPPAPGVVVHTGINASGPDGNTAWKAFANNWSSRPTTFIVYAVCGPKPAGYAQVAGGSVGNGHGTQTAAGVLCPAGDVVTGGGAAADGRVKIDIATSFPAANTEWLAYVSNASPVDDLINAVAVCASNTAYPTYSLAESAPVPDPAGKQANTSVSCPAGAMVLGGGNESSNITNVPIAMRGTLPFPASGTEWGAWENNASIGGTHLTAWAICP